MFQRARNLVGRRTRQREKDRMIALGGASAEWYDGFYGDGSGEYVVHYTNSRYLPVWVAICTRIAPAASILEIGCGPGQLAKMIDDLSIAQEYVGFDFSRAAIELAKRALPGKRLEVADARLTDLFATIKYDTVICTEVLEHVVDDVTLLERIPKGTKVLATVPNFDFESHVRFFSDAGAVRARYASVFTELEITEHHHSGDPSGLHGTFFLLNGLR